MTKRVQKCLFNTVCLSLFSLVALLCHGVEKETAGPSIKDAFASVQRYGKPYKTFYNNYIAPHAVLEKGIVFTAHQDGQGRPIVDAYDISKKSWTGPVRASNSGLGEDTHGNPSITVDAKGHVHVFFGCHTKAMKHVRSAAPYDITQWEDMPSPTPRATYPQSMRMADGSIYLFYRAGGHKAPWSMRVSKDDGRSWSEPQPVIEMRHNFPDKQACSYNAFVPGADYKTVHCFWVYKDDNPRGNNRKYQGMHEAVYRYNIYYAHRTSDGQWVAADGTPMSDLPVNKTFADRHAMLLDSGEEFTAPTRIVIDENDTPYIHIRQGVNDWKRGKFFVPYHYNFASPSNGNWQVHDNMPNQWPDLVKRLLLSAGPAAFGGSQPNKWFIHYEEGPLEDVEATYVWLGHLESGYAIRKNGPSSRFDLDYPMTLLPKARAANALEKTNPIKALADRVREYVNSQPLRFPNQHWVRGTYYAGLMAMYESTSDRAYLNDCMQWGKNVSWQIKEQGGGPYESGAYPLVCSQIWYGCYLAENDEMMMRPTLAFLEDPKVENPLSAPGEWYLENTGHRFVDGLFTAPPALAMLYQMTGEEKYVNWMDACFWDVHKEIFDRDAGLFYRDARSKSRKTKNGKKVLWSRGNGWAFGGLTRILKHLPDEHPSYLKYKSLYMEMAESLAKRQQADGFWRSNLDDPEQYPMKESSGTGFFCYGITWGINNGILNRERFLPVARKAWTALASVVNEDGKVGWSQPAGGGPGKAAEADISKFGTGIFLLAASEVFLLTQGEALAVSKPLGLQPGPSATVLLNGKPYRGIGINYFNCFLRTLKNGNDTSYDEGFATLAEKGIPFARFCATGFWPRDMKLYVEDREEYFRRLDGVVASAQKHGIGLIPSLFWYYACVPDLVGEPMDQWANPQSKTQAWMRHYVREVVTRYRDNPTIWAWELGNEFSLHANLPNAKDHRPKVHHSLGTPDARSARDDLTYEMVGKAFTAFATTVREHDPHRLIFTGDSFPRLSAWHNEQENSWTHDTMEQFAEMLTKANPDPISGIGLHAYEDDDQRFDEAMAVARKLNKPIFIGEFGAQHETEPQAAKFRRLLKAVVDNDIPLAAVWVFDYPHQSDFNINTDNGRAWQLELIAETNRKLRTQTRDEVHADVCVYGGTPGGITAAISAAREGASVVLLEQTRHVGGLTTSGLNRDECNHLDRQTLGGLCEHFLEEAVKRSNGRWTEGNSRTWQSGIAERVFLEMLEEAGVEVRYEQLLDQVKKDGARITELRVRGGEIYRAKVFIDATYEGDLMAKAGVSYSIGRESADHYGESIAGVRYLDDKVAISPFDDEGNLLFGVMPGEPPAAGSASEVPICYNVRLNITTDESKRVPIEKPSSYDPMQHELLARAIEAGLLKNLTSIIGIYSMGESSKRELNNRQFSIVSMSIPGAQTSWAEASFEERKAIHKKYRDYTHGILWFLKTDPRVPKHIRDEMAPYGFCKDEWADNNHWPYYLYIRAARRMQGEVVLTEADIIEDRDKEDVIHIGSHFIDCHHAARYVSDSGHIINEGRIWKQGERFDIPYRAITPKAGECSNLLVPVCASASHVAFCTVRLEPTWMQLGEAAGIAAAMAAKSGKSVQAVDVQSLQARLLKVGIPLEHPEGPMAYEKKGGKPRTFAPNDVVKAFFAGADKDGDGVASKSEWDSARPTWKWLFDHIDKDNNGQLDQAEYQAFQDFKNVHPNWRKKLESR